VVALKIDISFFFFAIPAAEIFEILHKMPVDIVPLHGQFLLLNCQDPRSQNTIMDPVRKHDKSQRVVWSNKHNVAILV
jgi:hypothetical protein